MTVQTVEWTDPRAAALREHLAREMRERYTGRHDDDPDFPAKAAVAFAVDPAAVVTTLLAVDQDGAALGHAAIRRLGDRLEVKNVIVAPDRRGRGVARALMAAVDAEVRRRGETSVLLQTGDRQPDAVRLYESIGYRRVPVYDPYKPITNSMCFEKRLDPAPSSVAG